MRHYFWIVVLTIFCVSCAKMPILIIGNGQVKDSLGIYLELDKEAKIAHSDWERFVKTTEDFIEEYNSEYKDFELYLSPVEQNSVSIKFLHNHYATSADRTSGIFITAMGIITPILMRFYKLPFVVYFWYVPRTATLVNVSITEDLLGDNKNHLFRIISKQGNKKDHELPAVQQKSYKLFLKFLIANIEFSPTYNFREIAKDSPDIIKLKDGRVVNCEVVNNIGESTFINVLKNDKLINTYFNNSDIEEVILDYNVVKGVFLTDILLLNDGREIECRILSEDDKHTYFVTKINRKTVETKISNSSIKAIKTDVNEQEIKETSIKYSDLIILNDGRKLFCEIIRDDKERTYFKFINNGKFTESNILNSEISEIISQRE